MTDKRFRVRKARRCFMMTNDTLFRFCGLILVSLNLKLRWRTTEDLYVIVMWDLIALPWGKKIILLSVMQLDGSKGMTLQKRKSREKDSWIHFASSNNKIVTRAERRKGFGLRLPCCHGLWNETAAGRGLTVCCYCCFGTWRSHSLCLR